MAQRTIASFFAVPRTARTGSATTPAGPTPLPSSTNEFVLRETKDNSNTQANNSSSATIEKKRAAPSTGKSTAQPPTKRPTAPRPFSKGADVFPLTKAGYNDQAAEFCHVDGSDYLLSDECWAVGDLTKPVSSWTREKGSFFCGRFKVIKGLKGIVVRVDGGVLRCHRVPDIGAAPLASLCLTHCAPSSEECECHKKSIFDTNAVSSMSSYAAASKYSPNLVITTGGGALKLISVTETEMESATIGGDGGDADGGRVTVKVTMTLVASLLLTEGPFKYAFPAPERGGDRLGSCVMWRDPADETDVETESAVGTSAAGGHRWAPITAAVVSSVNGQLCFIRLSPSASSADADAKADIADITASASSSPAAASAPAPAIYSCSAELRHTVTPHLPGAEGKRCGSHTAAAELWESGPGGAAVVSVGSDGNIVVTHFKRGECAAQHDNAWQCVTRGQSGAHMLAVCDRSGLAVTASQHEDDIHVWDLAQEKRRGHGTFHLFMTATHGPYCRP